MIAHCNTLPVPKAFHMLISQFESIKCKYFHRTIPEYPMTPPTIANAPIIGIIIAKPRPRPGNKRLIPDLGATNGVWLSESYLSFFDLYSKSSFLLSYSSSLSSLSSPSSISSSSSSSKRSFRSCKSSVSMSSKYP